MSRTVNRIPDEEKLRIVAFYLRGGISMRDLASQSGITSSCLCKWVRSYTTKGTFYRYDDVKNAEPKTNKPSVDTRDAEIARLKAALEKAELHVRALDTMIDIAEENFKIKIRKKAGAKQ